jgi:hypothetical protein
LTMFSCDSLGLAPVDAVPRYQGRYKLSIRSGWKFFKCSKDFQSTNQSLIFSTNINKSFDRCPEGRANPHPKKEFGAGDMNLEQRCKINHSLNTAFEVLSQGLKRNNDINLLLDS